MQAASTNARQSSSVEGLSLLALDAAIALDRLIEGSSTDVQSIENLFSLLDSGDSAVFAGGRKQLANPKTLDALNRAFRDTNVVVKTTDDIKARTSEYIKTFAENREARNVTALELLKRFCIALHNELLADTQRIRIEGRSRSREDRAWIL